MKAPKNGLVTEQKKQHLGCVYLRKINIFDFDVENLLQTRTKVDRGVEVRSVRQIEGVLGRVHLTHVVPAERNEEGHARQRRRR